jgi:oxygen-dependent protoporphyrinogen oxidase
MKPPQTAAVIGGGITGLVAAFRLRQSGIATTVFEAAGRAGGVIRTDSEGGWIAECGPNTLLETSPKITALIEEPALGIAERRRDAAPAGAKRYILKNGKPVMLPPSAAGFMKTPLFSMGAKLRLMAEPFIARRPDDAPEESLADFVRRRIGREFLDYAINPFVAGVYAGDPEKLSVRHAFQKIHALEREYGSLIRGQILGARKRKKRGTVAKDRAKQVSFDAGLQVLTDALAESLGAALRLGAKVDRLSRNADGKWSVVSGSDGGLSDSFDHVILALPAHAMANLSIQSAGGGGGENPAAEADMSMFSEIVYPPVAAAVLGFRREDVADPLDGFGTLNPEVEGVNTLGTLFTSTLFPARAPAGHVLLTTYLGGTRQPELAEKPGDDILKLVMDDLESIYGVRGNPEFVHVFTSQKAIPQYEVGYGKYLDFMEKIESAHPGLRIAGHCRDGISLSDSILSGEKVAEAISESSMDKH